MMRALTAIAFAVFVIAAARILRKKTAAKNPGVHVLIDNNGRNLPGQSPDVVVWDGEKDAAKRADINKGLF